MDVKSKYWGLVGGTRNSLPVTSKGLRRNREQGTEEIPLVKEMGQDIPGPGPWLLTCLVLSRTFAGWSPQRYPAPPTWAASAHRCSKRIILQAGRPTDSGR